MPELPEVECLTRAVRKVAEGATLTDVEFLRPDLRDPIPVDEFKDILKGQTIDKIFRRSKYMIWRTKHGFGLIHLGMTGHVLWMDTNKPQIDHTHAVFKLRQADGKNTYLHYVDPRRFGRIAAIRGDEYEDHHYFEALGPEPLVMKDLGTYLYDKSRGRKTPIKTFLMDNRIVVGVGNIYANEALFLAGVRPTKLTGKVSRAKFELLGEAIQKVLKQAIKAGGTTFRDFKNPDGHPGYFRMALNVYGRDDEECLECGKSLRHIKQAGRSTWYCPGCQN